MRKFVTTVMMFSALVSMAGTPKYLKLHVGGEIVPYALSDIRKITFGETTADALEVHQKGQNTVETYNFSTLENVVFEAEISGVGKVMANEVELSISYDDAVQEISVISSDDIQSVIVADLSGKVVEMLSCNSNEATISLANVATGLYIVKVVTDTTSKTKKILKY